MTNKPVSDKQPMINQSPNIWISLDLEMNNDPEIKDSDTEVESLVISDIIMIGACAFNVQTGEIVDKVRIYIQLPKGKVLHPKIIKLTGISQKQLNDDGRSLYLGYKELEYFVKKHKAFKDPLSWGGNDAMYLLKELQTKCSFNEKFIFGNGIYVEVKKLYQAYRLLQNKSIKSGLGKSLTKVGMNFVGRQHDALDDAINAARMFLFLINKMKL